MTKIARIALTLDPAPTRAWAEDFDGFKGWEARTGIDPSRAPKLVGGRRIEFEDFNAPEVLDAVRAAIAYCDEREAGRAASAP